MKSEYWYLSQMVRAKATFGQIFNNLKVSRAKSDKGDPTIITIPITHAYNDEVWKDMQNLGHRDYLKRYYKELPAFVYSLVDMKRISSQKRANHSNILNAIIGTDGAAYVPLTGIPYMLTFDLVLYADREIDAWQIFEQITPFFQPSQTFKVKGVVGKESTMQTQVTYLSEEFMTETDDDGRNVEMTFRFNMEWTFFGPSDHGRGEIIKEIDLGFFADEEHFPNRDYVDQVIHVTASPSSANSHKEVDKYITEFVK